ncbi:hypothetical protein GCK72_001144 [Caenorhabditis remanei]|uniref:Uncharacterized protein n=1 Tax=Caenorhabditis remanei TaxID=31234 RepID=A0A6A5HSL6_CAERE|nr:hypothetical protein GCK72_001144 [Caenorhabditis remanei]KAF1769327.1 hypothetical protein GCK72_001144 [Caenorhabditis remanei]
MRVPRLLPLPNRFENHSTTAASLSELKRPVVSFAELQWTVAISFSELKIGQIRKRLSGIALKAPEAFRTKSDTEDSSYEKSTSRSSSGDSSGFDEAIKSIKCYGILDDETTKLLDGIICVRARWHSGQLQLFNVLEEKVEKDSNDDEDDCHASPILNALRTLTSSEPICSHFFFCQNPHRLFTIVISVRFRCS